MRAASRIVRSWSTHADTERPGCQRDLRDQRGALTNGEGGPVESESVAACYFSFTKSNTKIAHTPTVMGNCTKEASRSGPPLGRRYVAAIIARAVNTPSKNLLFQFMFSPTLPRPGTSRMAVIVQSVLDKSS